MREFRPERIYYEPEIERYELGRELLERYRGVGIPAIEILSHNRIEELLHRPNEEYLRMKRFLVLGTRKTLRLTPNDKSADYIVPFTSSGCSAMCLYCYLMCHFNLNSYLRIFVNREQMMELVRKKAQNSATKLVFELGSNSDMVLEETITGNLRWAIEEFGKMENAVATFATKFDGVDSLLTARHNGHTQMRISVNPQSFISRVELGTSGLKERIKAANRMFQAGYRMGINIAPVILTEGWEQAYTQMFEQLREGLEPRLQNTMFIEVIFMTYSAANQIINTQALPSAPDLFEREKFRPKGRGKYCYRDEVMQPAKVWMTREIAHYFPTAEIRYIV